MPSKQSCCCGGDKVVMTVACSGRSNTGQLTNDAAKLIDRTGTARFVCLAAIGAEDPEVTDLAKCAGRLLVLDGCEKACARKIMEKAGFREFVHLDVTQLGIEKRLDSRYSDGQLQTVIAAAERLSAGMPLEVRP
ncbi:MAG: putative zinc-binding protein [Candidatus Sumerlaeia bacterium]|nr:putative zinc-binding protein [Candidatus Sumerlaeia bacterium]